MTSGLDAPPSRKQTPRRAIEGVDIAAAPAGLVVCAADRHTFQMAQQQRAHSAVRDNSHVASCRSHGKRVVDGRHDPALRIDGAFPSAHAVPRSREERIRVRHITSEHYFRQPVSNTFHGRDIFAPVAAYLAKFVDSDKFGDEIEDYVRFAAPRAKATGENRMRGVILKVDRFGNLITNITPEDAPALFSAKSGAFKIVVGSKEITEIRKAYAEGSPGEVFGVLGSMGYLEIVANRAAAAQLTGAGKGSEVTLFLGEAAAAGKGA